MRALVVLALAAALANAASISWTGYANDNQWTNKINWSPDTVPGPNDDVTINSGNVLCTIATGVNSLTMGTLVQSTANLTLFQAFAVGNGGMTVEENGNLIINTGTNMVFGQVTVGGNLNFVDGLLGGSWTIAPRASANLGNANEKGFSAATFVSQGQLSIGGVIVLNQSSTITLQSPTSANSNLFIQNGDGSQVLFDASAATFTFSTAVLQVQAPVQFGKFVLQSGNVSILDSLTFSQSLNIPANSYVSSAGTAALNISAGATGAGVLTLAGTTSSLYDISMSGYVNAVGGDVIFYTSSDVGVLTISGGNTVMQATVYPNQLNLLSGTTSGNGMLQAASLLVDTKGLTLGSPATANKSATLMQSVLTFGPVGSLAISSGATATVTGQVMLTSGPNGKGVTNNGKIQVQAELQLSNVPVMGSGSLDITSKVTAQSTQVTQGVVSLSSGASISGQTTWVTLGEVKNSAGGVVKAKLGEYTFQCPGQCDHVVTPSSQIPPAPFSFSA
uniref:G8 domain-containing protein n=2 Tax=Neobodo designis TaxID=312471 RepID=A0A6U4PD94_NEODS